MEWATGETALRLFAALIAAGVLGALAERKGRPAGLRTHVFVGVGAATFCLVARTWAGVAGADPLRALQGVAGGIGLVAAATVLRRSGGVIGVTTAASIWVAAALGCDAGLGYPLRAIFIGVMLAALSYGLRLVERRIFRSKNHPP